MPVLFYYFKRNWEAIDAWLWEAFGFGFYELGYLAQDFLIEVTK